MNKDTILEDLSKDEILAVVELYRKAGVADVPVFDTKKAAVPWLEEARTLHGVPHEADGTVTLEQQTPVTTTATTGETVTNPNVTVGSTTTGDFTPEAPSVPEAAPVSVNEGVTQTPAPAPAPVQQLWHRGKAVMSVSNKLVNGVTYKEIAIADGSLSLLTEAEFAAEVRER